MTSFALAFSYSVGWFCCGLHEAVLTCFPPLLVLIQASLPALYWASICSSVCSFSWTEDGLEAR